MQLKLTTEVTVENPILGDLALVDGKLYFFSEEDLDKKAEIAQKIKSTLSFLQGEWFLDLRQGLPIFRDVIGNRPVPQALIRASYRSWLLGIPGVRSVISLDLRFDPATRVQYVNFKVDTDVGEIADSSTFQPLIVD